MFTFPACFSSRSTCATIQSYDDVYEERKKKIFENNAFLSYRIG